MKTKVKMIVLIFIGLLLSLGIGIGKTIAVNNYGSFSSSTVWLGYGDLKQYTNILCIANGYRLNTARGEYTVKNTVNIGPRTKGKSNAKMAYFCYYAYNIENKNGGNYIYSKSQNAIWRYWKPWYDANLNNKYDTNNPRLISNVFNIRSKTDSSSAADSLEEEAEKYYNVLNGDEGININNKKATQENATYTTGKGENTVSHTYKYIGPFTISVEKGYSSYVTDTIKGFSITGVSIKGYTTSVGTEPKNSLPTSGKEFYIVCNQNANITTDTDITLSYEINTYSATIKLLYRGRTWQNLIWVNGSKSKGTATTTFNIKKEGEQEVSLQKYIVGVNGVNNLSKNFLVTDDSSSIGRRNLIANSNYKAEDDKNISKFNNNKVSNIHSSKSEYYKINKPVIIKPGDIVYYKIVVYNNGASDTKKAYIKDRISKEGELLGIYNKLADDPNDKDGLAGVVTTIKDENNMVFSDCGCDDAKYKDSENYRYYKWHIDDSINSGTIKAGSYKEYYIKVRYNNFFEGKVANKAWVYSSNASETKRTVDFDYVQMLQSDISLQKYITKVNNNAVISRNNRKANDETIYNIYKNSNGTVQGSSGTNKEKDVVDIEVGDYVTYNITVYNNSSTAVTNINVIDEIPDYATMYRWGGYNNKTGYTNVPNDGRVKYKIGSLAGYGHFNIEITLYFGKFEPNVVQENFAVIENTDNGIETQFRIADSDYVKMKEYKVNLEKYVYKYGTALQNSKSGRLGHPEYGTHPGTSESDKYKYNNIINVEDLYNVQYAINVTNEGNTQVFIDEIKDVLPSGLEYVDGHGNISGAIFDNNRRGRKTLNVTYTSRNGIISITNPIREEGVLLNTGEHIRILITFKVREPNISLNIIKNEASINKIKNKNNFDVYDSCTNDNKDADYIQLTDIPIKGKVWKDGLEGKEDNIYDGKYNDGEELLNGIIVKLYRDGVGVVSETRTNKNGEYAFSNREIRGANGVIEFNQMEWKNTVPANERYIKASKNSSNDRWNDAKIYYNYYILFEYDGVTYTSTIDGTQCVDVTDNKDYKINSNARENNGKVQESRENFNTRFSKIRNGLCVEDRKDKNKKHYIDYDTINNYGNSPESIYKYNSEFMAIDSSTNLIKLSRDSNLQDHLLYINLGLRKKDKLDLQLKSDVSSIKVTVNGQTGTYDYTNKVTVRKGDTLQYGQSNDSRRAGAGTMTEEVTQNIRKTDIATEEKLTELTGSNYTDTGLEIIVTYRIKIENVAKTLASVNMVRDYYDSSKYDCVKVYGNVYSAENINTYITGINAIEITTGDNKNSDIYIEFKLKDAQKTLAPLLDNESIKTYNIAEIYEYSSIKEGQSEFIRGLIDKDSEPGNITKQEIFLQDNEKTWKDTSKTTLLYYFTGKNLNQLKYEDDTYATPTLIFTSSDKGRELSGTVFKDNTNTINNIKSGNGIQDSGEDIVFNATVKLIELVKNKDEVNEVERYTEHTKSDGKYTFKNFLPGNYKIKYQYGDTTKTVLLKQSEDGNVNKYSFNGEDYQSTNNTGNLDGTNELNKTKNYWYVYNENKGVSTGTDDVVRRKKVSQNVTEFTDDEMIALNKMRAGKEVTNTERNNIINKTNMFAITPDLTLSVEKTVQSGEDTKQNDTFGDYIVKNMNFGIAEVPVTTINLQKNVTSFTIKDSTGNNIIASAKKDDNGYWKKTGDVIPLEGSIFDVSIEDQKLQGAKLEVTYNIKADITIEKNFDGKASTQPTLTGVVDMINNNLSYNQNLGENSNYWEVITRENLLNEIKENSVYKINGTIFKDDNRKTSLDPEGKKYTTIVKGNEDVLNKLNNGETVPITLEKVLSSQDVTLGNIITSSVNSYEYDNIVEITGIKYDNTETGATENNFSFRDRVRTPKTDKPTTSRMTILAGKQNDTATSETITIHPPTGENNNIIYYIIAIISISVLAVGIVLIRKYAIKKNK